MNCLSYSEHTDEQRVIDHHAGKQRVCSMNRIDSLHMSFHFLLSTKDSLFHCSEGLGSTNVLSQPSLSFTVKH